VIDVAAGRTTPWLPISEDVSGVDEEVAS